MRKKGVLVEENSAMVLGDHVQDLRQGTVGDKACTLQYAVSSQKARTRTSCRSRVPGPGALQSVASCADQNEDQDQENRRYDCSKNSGAGFRSA